MKPIFSVFRTVALAAALTSAAFVAPAQTAPAAVAAAPAQSIPMPQPPEIAARTYERHNVIADIFIHLGVSRETAYADACRVEHYISQETFDCMKQYFKKED